MSSSNTSTIMGALALVTVLFFIALLALQAGELFHYRADPSVWPLP